MIAVIGIGTRYSFGVFLKSLEGEFGISRGATSGIFSVYMLLCSLLAIIGGWALDKYGPRKIAFLMGSFTGLSLVLTSQTNSVWQLFITYGLLLAPFATYLISIFGWRIAFLSLGLIAWIIMASMSLLLRKDPSDIGLSPDGVKSEPVQTASQTKESLAQPIAYSVVQAFRTSQFWLLGFTWIFLSLCLHLIFVHAVPHAVDMGISPMDASVMLSLMGAANIPARLVVGKVSDTIGRKTLGVACILAQFAALLWLMWADVLWMLYIFAITYGFLWGGSGTIITSLIGDVFGMRSLGAIMGVMTAGWALGAAVGPAMGGYIFDMSDNYFAAFATAAAATLISALFVALIRKTPKDRTPRKRGSALDTKQTGRLRL
jgi:MFS family permease